MPASPSIVMYSIDFLMSWIDAVADQCDGISSNRKTIPATAARTP
jgi:hypothetical protein